MSSEEDLADALIEVLCEEVRTSKRLRKRLMGVIRDAAKLGAKSEGVGPEFRRRIGAFDPLALYRESPEGLAEELDRLDLEGLKDIVAEHNMDRKKLAMRWKAKEKLIELILRVAKERARKGDAFRS